MSKFIQKWIDNSLALQIKSYQKHLQKKENIRYGRKAKTISFQKASSNVKGLAEFIGGKRN